MRALWPMLSAYVPGDDAWWLSDGFALYRVRPPTDKQRQRVEERVSRHRGRRIEARDVQRVADLASESNEWVEAVEATGRRGDLECVRLVCEREFGVLIQERYYDAAHDAQWYIGEDDGDCVRAAIGGEWVAFVMPVTDR